MTQGKKTRYIGHPWEGSIDKDFLATVRMGKYCASSKIITVYIRHGNSWQLMAYTTILLYETIY